MAKIEVIPPKQSYGVRELPKVKIGGKLYFRDDRLEEFRRVDRPGDRPIKFEELGAYATGEEVRAIFGTAVEKTPKEIISLLHHAITDLERGDTYSAASDVSLAVKEFERIGIKVPKVKREAD